MNWRLEIKKAFAGWCLAALGSDLKGFEAWNNQISSYKEEETSAQMKLYFEYSEIGDGTEYMKQTNIQQSEKVPVVVTLHIVFDDYTDATQDAAYTFAGQIIDQIQGMKHSLVSGRILKVSENEDINHRSKYDYQIQFRFIIKEAVGAAVIKTDANPIDNTNPVTGRKLRVEIDADLQ